MKYSIGTQGFDDYHQNLLKEQLKVVSGRVHDSWEYAGETPNATLVLSRHRPCNSNCVLQAVFVEGELPPQRERPYQLFEWPARIMNLLDLMTQVEKKQIPAKKAAQPDMPPPTAIPSTGNGAAHAEGANTESLVTARLRDMAAQITASNCLAIQAGEVTAQVVRISDQFFVQSDAGVKALAKALGTPQAISLELVPLQLANQKSGFNLDCLLWQLALTEQADQDQQKWSANQCKLLEWPDFSRFYRDELLLRLSAAFTKKPLDIATACRMTRANEAQVIGFLRACELVGVRMSILPTATSSTAASTGSPQADTRTRQLSFLANLRNKLKTALS